MEEVVDTHPRVPILHQVLTLPQADLEVATQSEVASEVATLMEVVSMVVIPAPTHKVVDLEVDIHTVVDLEVDTQSTVVSEVDTLKEVDSEVDTKVITHKEEDSVADTQEPTLRDLMLEVTLVDSTNSVALHLPMNQKLLGVDKPGVFSEEKKPKAKMVRLPLKSKVVNI